MTSYVMIERKQDLLNGTSNMRGRHQNDKTPGAKSYEGWTGCFKQYSTFKRGSLHVVSNRHVLTCIMFSWYYTHSISYVTNHILYAIIMINQRSR